MKRTIFILMLGMSFAQNAGARSSRSFETFYPSTVEDRALQEMHRDPEFRQDLKDAQPTRLGQKPRSSSTYDLESLACSRLDGGKSAYQSVNGGFERKAPARRAASAHVGS